VKHSDEGQEVKQGRLHMALENKAPRQELTSSSGAGLWEEEWGRGRRKGHGNMVREGEGR